MTNNDNTAWWYRNGKWERGPQPIKWDEEHHYGTWDKAATACGFYKFSTNTPSETYTSVIVYHRPPKNSETHETWAIVLDSEGSEEVYTTSLPDTMAVLAQWAPAVNLLNCTQLSTIIAEGLETAAEYFAQTNSRVNLEEVARIIRGAR